MRNILTAAILSLGLLFSTVVTADSAELRGNPSSKIYHSEKCQFYNGKGVTEKFSSAAEAQKKGFSPCKNCVAVSVAKTGFVGNAKSKVFHKANCSSAPKANAVALKSPQEAKANGFKPCSICKP